MKSRSIDLRSGPFTLRDARQFGMTWHSLQSRAWRRISYGQYAWTGLRHDVELELRAIANRIPTSAAFSGATAAWIHGLDMAPCNPAEVTVERDVAVRGRVGIRLRRAALPDCDVDVRRGFRVTAPLRTVHDLGSRKDVVESVVAIDMALHAGIVELPTLVEHVQMNAGAKGIKRLRQAVSLANSRAESPMETRLRLAIVSAGLPAPSVQIELHDSTGLFVGRADLYYPDVRLVIEFDGQNHKDRLVADVRRQNALVNADYHVLRFTAADLRNPRSVAFQVGQARDLLSRTH
ncbi:MAG TPA: DUF559 domain-containing protein [Candidatus Dormibacteraeota bacterium]|nr:DUF559 domain-containing protein [Candidatus Dormibacteraeota bacterium]